MQSHPGLGEQEAGTGPRRRGWGSSSPGDCPPLGLSETQFPQPCSSGPRPTRPQLARPPQVILSERAPQGLPLAAGAPGP